MRTMILILLNVRSLLKLLTIFLNIIDSCIISDHAARDLLAICDRAIILANKKIIKAGTVNEVLNDEISKNLYFGDSFKIN